MRLTERFYDNVRWYKDTVADIEAGYARQMEYADRFRGSEAFKDIKQQADAERAEALNEQKKDFLKHIREITAAMRENARNHKSAAPTSEQVNLLTVLKMRDHLTADEIKRAANTLKGCPDAIAALHDIARAHKLTVGLDNPALTISCIMQHIDSMERTAIAMLRGEGVGANCTPKDEADTLTRFGAFGYLADDMGGYYVNNGRVNEPLIAGFSAIVNGDGEGAGE